MVGGSAAGRPGGSDRSYYFKGIGVKQAAQGTADSHGGPRIGNAARGRLIALSGRRIDSWGLSWGRRAPDVRARMRLVRERDERPEQELWEVLTLKMARLAAATSDGCHTLC